MTFLRLLKIYRPRTAGYVLYVVLLVALFSWPLGRLVFHAAQSPLHSHGLLVPFIVGYLLYVSPSGGQTALRSSTPGAVTAGGLGLTLLAASLVARGSVSVNDELALTTLAFVSLVGAGGFLWLGSRWMLDRMFPMAFLLFMVPLPDAWVEGLETLLVLASSEAAAMFLWIFSIPVVRQGVVFELPGIVLRVGQECSGIRSSLVLLITSVLGAHLLLRSRWRRAVVVAFVVPLGVLRNGFRILVIALACVRVGPHMIDSTIHRQGGPVFFVLSLIPLGVLMWWLRRGEGPRGAETRE